MTFWSILATNTDSLTASLEVCHTPHTHTTHTLWGELAAHPGAEQEPKGNTPESLPSQCQRAEREKRQSTHVTQQRHTHTHAHTLSLMNERDTHTLWCPHREGTLWQSELSFNVLLIRGMIFWYFIDLLSLFAALPGGSVMGGQTDTSVGGSLSTWKIWVASQLKDGPPSLPVLNK